MKDWKRITVVVFVLIGGTISFGYWSLNEFDYALDSLSALSISTVSPVSISTSTPILISPQIETPENLELLFTFPKKGDEVYIGCEYMISWQSSTTINFIGVSLVDAGTQKSIGPVASGISKENIIDIDSSGLKWKVGVVWPGEYYIAVSKINDVEMQRKSRVFVISKMPGSINTEEREKICQESGGSL